MKWLRDALLRVLRSSIDLIVQESLEKAVAELNEEIDVRFKDKQERENLKSGVVLLRQRVEVAVRERLS